MRNLGLTSRRTKGENNSVLFPVGPKSRLVGIARLAAGSDLLEARRRVEYFDLPTRKLLNRTTDRMPFQWTINPYRGCEFGCRYCYARYTHEFMELDAGRGFEEQIYGNHFTAAGLRAELSRIPRAEAIAIGTATDPYQPAERRFGLTREILRVFAGERGRRVSLTTKSDLVVRDVELFQAIALANVFHVNVTITTLDERLARLLERRAPRPELRLAAVRTLADAGIAVGVFPNPILPLLTDSEESLDELARASAAAGASFFGGGLLFLKPCAAEVFLPFLEHEFPHLVEEYRRLFHGTAFLRGEYADRVKERARRIRARHRLADSPVEYTPERWDEEPRQGELFGAAPPARARCGY
jgi:DNA repair photolyase